jgi:putative DNA primase/helicase
MNILADNKRQQIKEYSQSHTYEESVGFATVLCPNSDSANALKTVDLIFHKIDYHLTDLGNAERFIDRHGDILRYSYERKKWLLWNGKYWGWVDDGAITALASETIRDIYRQVAGEPDKDRRKALIDHAKWSESERRLSAMISLAQTIAGVAVRIDLRTGIIKPHDKNDYITSFIAVDYDPSAGSTLWNSVLDTIFDGNPAIKDYVQRALGYSCTGCQDEQVTFFPHGAGANGKSTVVGAVRDTLGADYATEIEPQVFMAKQNTASGPNEGMARLYRKRLAISTEIEDGQRLSIGLIKRMTGGEKLHHEKKFEHGFEFTPTHKLWLSGNHKPIITDTTLSIWRRVKFINFNTTIPENKRIKNLREQLKATEHQRAILAWLVAGCVEWIKNGLGEPPEITEATHAYRDEMDLLADFVKERCLIQASETITAAELYNQYRTWAENNEPRPLGKNTFNRKLKEKGFSTYRGNGNKLTWKGIRVMTIGEEIINQSQDVTSVTKNQESTPMENQPIELIENSVTEVTKITESTNESSAEEKPPDELPDCPSCGHNNWTYNQDGNLQCSCGYTQSSPYQV